MSEVNTNNPFGGNAALAAFYEAIKNASEQLLTTSDSSSEVNTKCVNVLTKKFLTQLQSVSQIAPIGTAPVDQSGELSQSVNDLAERLLSSLSVTSPVDPPPQGEMNLGRRAVLSVDYREDSTPELLSPEDIRQDSRDAAVLSPDQPSSALYRSKTPRHLQKPGQPETMWDKNDEYRDDDDPGYRIRDIYEKDLLAELQAKLAHPVVYASLFTSQPREAPIEHVYEANRVVKTILDKRERQRLKAEARLHQQQQQQQFASFQVEGDATSRHVSHSANATGLLTNNQFNNTTPVEGEATRMLGSHQEASSSMGEASMSSSKFIAELEGNISPARLPQLPSEVQSGQATPTQAGLTKELLAEMLKQETSSEAQLTRELDQELHATLGASMMPPLEDEPVHESGRFESPSGQSDGPAELALPTSETLGGKREVGSFQHASTRDREPRQLDNPVFDQRYASVEQPQVREEPSDELTPEELEVEELLRAAHAQTALTSSLNGVILDPSTGQAVLVTDPDLRRAHRTLRAEGVGWGTEYAGGSVSGLREQKKRKKQQWLKQVAGDLRHSRSADPYYPRQVTVNVPQPKSQTGAHVTSVRREATLDCFQLRVVFERERTGFEDHKDLVLYAGDLVAGRYEVLGELGAATFSRAVQCLDRVTGRAVCLKIIKNDKEFLDQSLDEIKLLRYINANCNPDEANVLRLLDYFYHREHLMIVTEVLRDNLYDYTKYLRDKQLPGYFTLGRLQRISKQILQALKLVHSLRLVHSDLKPENILFKRYAQAQVKVIDFGSSCFEDDVLSTYLQSRAYRAPEVILGLPFDSKIDIWSLGCIIAELWTGYVLFQNDSVVSLLARVMGILGRIPAYMIAKGRFVSQFFTQDGQLYAELDEQACKVKGRKIRLLIPKPTNLWQRLRTDDELFLSFVHDCLQIDPSKRKSAAQLLNHKWLTQVEYSDGLSQRERRALETQALKEALLPPTR